MWAYIPESGKRFLPRTKKNEVYEIRFASSHHIIIIDNKGFNQSIWLTAGSKKDWRIVLKPRIRRMGVIG